MSTRILRSMMAMAACLALFALAPGAVGETTATSWEAPSEGAAEMFRQGSRVFAVGAQSGGAGVSSPVDDTNDLPPAPGGTPIPDSRCAMEAGSCDGGVCISYVGFYCKTGDCSGRKFC